MQKLTKFVDEQLAEIHEMKRQLVAKDHELQELTVKTFAELKEKPSADSQSIEELADQVRTKEEEI